MTTRIKIVNESHITHPDSHIVQVEHAGSVYKIAPGYDYTLHVWQGMEVKITEVLFNDPK
jgi:hypothetical protein